MIKKKENCEYCGEKMESKTAKKRFCSEKCRVYFNRTSKYADDIVSELDNVAKKRFKLDDSFVNAMEDAKNKLNALESLKNRNPEPPIGLKGIDLTIWKSENWK
jgi:endogenous inhibitor of DNA gyrase (YacG/DUF329 family)